MKKKYDKIYVTIGASNHTDKNRAENDYYSTDESAITLLHKHNLLDKYVPYWETLSLVRGRII